MSEVKKRYSLDELVEVTYYQSQFAYKRYNWYSLNYTLDDFKQDAVLHILDLYSRDYFEYQEDGSLNALIYSLLSGFFVYNKLKEKIAERSHVVSLDAMQTNDFNEMVLEDIDGLTPEEETDIKKEYKLGEETYNELLDTFKLFSTNATQLDYVAKINGKNIELSYYIIAKLILDKTRRADIVKLFSQENRSKQTYVSRFINKTTERLKQYIGKLDEHKQKALETYVFDKLTFSK